MKNNKFMKVALATVLAFTGVCTVVGCNKEDTTKAEKSEQEKLYEEYVSNMKNQGETPVSYEEWLKSVKGEIGGTIIKNKYNITYDYGVASNLFEKAKTSDSISTTQWIENMPKIKDEYKDSFLGWYIKGSDKKIDNHDYLGGDVTLEARFNIEKALSGVYQNGKYISTWSEMGTKLDEVQNQENLDIVLDKSIKSLSLNSFSDINTNFRTIVIHSDASNISSDAFFGLDKLENIIVSSANPNYFSKDGVLFDSNNVLIMYPSGKKQTSYIIPEGTKVISRTFNGNKYLEKVTIPESVEGISSNAFISSDLKYIEVVDGNRYFKSKEGVLFGLTTLIKYPSNKEGKEYTIPSNITTIESHAFTGAKNLEKVIISESVTNVGGLNYQNPFSGSNIKCIEVAQTNPNFSSKEGVLFNKDKTILVAYPSNKEDVSYKIPDTVIELGSYAFSNSKNTKIIDLSNVSKIKSSAFYYTDLESIVITDKIVELNESSFFMSSINILTIETSLAEESGIIHRANQKLYVKQGLSITVSNSWVKQTVSDKDGYDMYVNPHI